MNNPNNQGSVIESADDANWLGEDAQNSDGADESFTFQVAGVDGVAGATTSDDTAATAQNLGNITGDGVVQVSGTIGVDPNLPDNPADQVDLYHFQVSSPGQYTMLAEVFAGRIGSTLDPGVSLFKLDPSDGQLVFIDGNDTTFNSTVGTDGTVPLASDAVLDDGLTAGDYYLAVTDAYSTPLPFVGQQPGSYGVYDPNVPDSAQNGWTTGPYLLNLLVQPAPTPPRVVASWPSPGQILARHPRRSPYDSRSRSTSSRLCTRPTR